MCKCLACARAHRALVHSPREDRPHCRSQKWEPCPGSAGVPLGSRDSIFFVPSCQTLLRWPLEGRVACLKTVSNATFCVLRRKSEFISQIASGPQSFAHLAPPCCRDGRGCAVLTHRSRVQVVVHTQFISQSHCMSSAGWWCRGG